jgi:VWFA-related protein
MERRLLLLIGLMALPLAPVQAGEPAAAQSVARGDQSQSAPQPPTKFHSSVDMVSVSAVVRDKKGRFVSNMEQKDFTVAEGGLTRRIVDFRAQENGPVKVALLFDISGSMRVGSKAIDARQAARQIFGALKPGDEAAVFAFDTRLDRVVDFTSDLSSLESSLDHIEPPFGQTSMYDAIAETARAVSAASTDGGRLPERTAVVVLTDGIDTRSRLTPEQVSGIASAIDVPVYIMAVMSPIDDDREPGGRTDAVGPLGNLARWTGGDFFPISAPAHASIAVREIVEELRHQYVLAFEASSAPGWRPLEVRVKDRELRVRARAGYTVAGTAREAER